MKDEDLDRLLAGAPLPDPGPAFTWAVMAQVRREAAAPPPLAFPWRRLARGREMMRQRLAGRVIAPAAAEGR